MSYMFLDRIVKEKLNEVEHRQKTVPLSRIETAARIKSPPRDLAAALAGDGISLIAEGVESEDQLALLRDLECQEAQGYLFGKPMAVPEMEEWLERQLS